MNGWERTLIAPDTTLRTALQVIDATGVGIALVVDEQRRLLGTLSDGDIRRALIVGGSLEDKAGDVLNPQPTVVRTGQSRSAILARLRELSLHQLPILDPNDTVAGLATIDDYLKIPERENAVVIMAGGRGERLSELTRDTPKPMLKVGVRPILETIIMNYAAQGFRNFFLAVNYKAEQIEAHFGDGSSRGLNIRYLREKMRLGTGGALSLLPEAPTAPIVVSNGDVLSKEDYGLVLDGHCASDAQATILTRTYEVQVPFGVVSHGERGVTAIEEKPTHRYTINGGVYVLSPEAVSLVPRDVYFDLPTLVEKMLASGMKVRCHTAESYWMDIGRIADYERANADFGSIFE
ncbi:MAG: CBS domain-containing protein [Brevundimonas sp.]|uniref:nucleotidyltransferase family protein n=1 Tax=Brevundimonas sp. TaxID=1871086 RepID=UPI0017C5C52C|nr:nucleotidyltransferase family protein [Brevundimonas sp.]MBA4804668.1 CBS domain-containing protein [Brevundimonas sp.]